MTEAERSTQARVVAFLSRPDAYSAAVDRVETIETHGALVFLAGPEVYKIKRQVAFSYMDFSTLELRRRCCEREIAINKPHAPELYIDVVAITEDANGRLALAGAGTPVEWAVRMRRFDQDDLLSTRAALGPFAPVLCRQLADAVFAFHEAATIARPHESAAQMAVILRDVVNAFKASGSFGATADIDRFEQSATAALGKLRPLLALRANEGLVRRCHGDLHLANVVVWKASPVLFDAIEFDEALATIDVLYDLAFLVMDLDHHDQRAAANAVLNRYLWRSQQIANLKGLAAFPLFLALRAGVRAMVAVQRAGQSSGAAHEMALARARGYLERAASYLGWQSPRLIAVGGLSGTGKSTLATALAPGIGRAPGAVHLRSDLERKAHFKKAETERLSPEAYTPQETARIYALLAAKADAILRAGHSVIVDAVYSHPDERAQIERIAQQADVPFVGFWLEAPAEALVRRVGARTGDASDATPEVVRQQLAYDTGPMNWQKVAAGGDADATRAAALTVLDANR